jgi:hypothetical protein
MPDTTWPISRHPPGSIPGWAGRPVSMSSIAVFDTSSVVRSRSPSWPTPDALTARLTPRTLTTTALDRSSSGWLAASPCRATAEDHRPQGRPLHLRCNTASVSPTFYTDLLSAFVAHPTRLRSPNKGPCPGSTDPTASTRQSLEQHFHAANCGSDPGWAVALPRDEGEAWRRGVARRPLTPAVAVVVPRHLRSHRLFLASVSSA